jgi:hypothetical protein
VLPLKAVLVTIICASLFIFNGRAQEVITGGNMEDSTAWNFYWVANALDTGTWEINHTGDLPAAGDGGCYMVSGGGQSHATLWQAIEINPGHKYYLTGAFRNASVDSVINTWVELFITRIMPTGDMATDIGYRLNTWDKPDTLNFDGTFQDNFILSKNPTGYIIIPDTVTQTEWYLVLKTGCWNTLGDPDPTFIFLIDELSLMDLGVVPTVLDVAKMVDAPNIADTNDYKVTLTMDWDVDTLYMQFDVNDDSIATTAHTDIWMNDNIEIYLDMTNGKVANWPRTNTWPPAYEGQPGYYQFRIVPGTAWDAYNTAALTTRLVYTETEDGYQFMVNIPWDTLSSGFVPELGTQIGFDILASDNDADPNYRDQVSWNAPYTLIYVDPASWGTLQITPNGFFPVPDSEKPTAPANLAAEVNENDVTLTWDPSTDNIVVHQYIIRQGSDPIDTIIAKQTGNTYTIQDLENGDYSFRVKAVDISGNESAYAPAVDATVNYTSLSEDAFARLILYPNPARDILNISSGELIESITITDIAGKEIMKVSINSANIQLNIESLSSGVYFITVNFGDKATVNRIVIE